MRSDASAAMRSGPGAAGWLALIRPPALVTVPGDPLAGALLASLAGAQPRPGRVALAVCVSLGLYLCGLLTNDLCDLEEDRSTRPGRPLPAGRVPIRSVMAAAVGCSLAGLLAAAALGLTVLKVALVLQIGVLLYNARVKQNKVLGALLMGCCRELSLLLGAIAVGWRPLTVDAVGLAAMALMLYVCGVTLVAFEESNPVRLGGNRWIPAFACLAGCAGIGMVEGRANPLFLLLGGGAAFWSWLHARRLGDAPETTEVRKGVGALLRGLLLLQAAFCALPGGAAGALFPLVLVALAPAGAALAHRFEAS